MLRTKWTERKFTFDYPEGWIYNILERLRGTAPRLRELTKDLSEQQLIRKPEGKWSILEHIGHLIDLEDLHEGRIDDFLARKPDLRAADMTNARTNQASHNDRSLEELIRNFESRRQQFIVRLISLDDETSLFRSLHPRLQVLMRPIDVAYFTAEHDDHHLATIRELIQMKD